MIVLIAGLIILNFHQCSNTYRAESALEAATADATFWKDKNGHSNAEILVLKADRDIIKKTNADLVDSLKKEGIKIKNTKRVVTVTKHTTDTISVSRANFSSHWLDYEWIDEDRLAFTVKDSIALITHNKKYGFLNLRTSYVTRAISYNPHTILTGITSIEITPKRQKIGLGFYGGYGLTFRDGVAYVGPQLGFGVNIRL